MPRQHTMLRLLLLHATAAAFPMLGAEISLGERTKMSWDPPPNGDDGVDHFQLFLPRRWSKDQRWPMLIFLHGAGDGVWASAYIKLSRRVDSHTADSLVDLRTGLGRDEQPVAPAAALARPVDGLRSEEELGV